MKEALEQNESKEEIKEETKEETEPEKVQVEEDEPESKATPTEEKKPEEEKEPEVIPAEERKPEEEKEPETAPAEECKPEEEPEVVRIEEDKTEKIQESKEAQEAATMELTAEPYVIPKAAFKMPAWAKTCIITVAVLLLLYGAGSLFFSSHFMWNSSLNGVDVSLLTAEQAQEKLEDMVEQYELEILERDGERETIAGADIQLDIRFLADVRGVMQQQKVYLWFLECFRSKAYAMDTRITYDIRSLQEQIQGLACMQKGNITEPVEPQITQVLGGFTVQEGIEGNKPLSYAVGKSIRTAVSGLSAQVDLEAEGCYAVLEYQAEDSVVQEALAILEKLQKVEITYRFPDTEETLTGDDILKWVRISEDYAVEIDSRQVEDYVEYLMENHEIRGQTIDFQTSLNQSVEVTSYLRSSEVDTGEEAAELVALLEQAKDSRRTEFVRDASDMAAIGDTYIEINLTSQHLYCYKDGEMILETDMVSGRPSTGHATPPGVFTIRYTASPAILVGEDYRTPVSYWMPFNGGIGLHDATWQYAFGGSRYISNGSHGCINLPLNMAREIYNNYEAGDIVVVYHLPGSAAGTSASSVSSAAAPARTTTAEEAPAASEEGAASTVENPPQATEATEESTEAAEAAAEASSEQAEPVIEETIENQNP
ncbi:MAG: L,D-transpeptidase family protein [Bacteroides sp.]|nr:L,D-transpeptidase family protein [Bacteroides sp.]MCM1549294.1 L,D-transpeptidase family protein [Clostridium sp.]